MSLDAEMVLKLAFYAQLSRCRRGGCRRIVAAATLLLFAALLDHNGNLTPRIRRPGVDELCRYAPSAANIWTIITLQGIPAATHSSAGASHCGTRTSPNTADTVVGRNKTPNDS